MNRRTLLVAAAAAAAGCIDSGGNDGSDGGSTDATTSTATPTPTPSGSTDGETDTESGTASVRRRVFERRDACDERGSAAVSTDGDAVVVTGCITGRNGCVMAVLDETAYDDEVDELRVVVGTEKGTDGDVCTQALTALGYRCRVGFDGRRPATTVVVHDGAGGASTVAEAETR